MKKISMIALALVFLLGATGAIAQDKGSRKDVSKPLKAEKVKLFGKKSISGSDREKGNILEDMMIKGKPVKPAPPAVDPTSGGVTGTIGATLPEGGQKYAIVIGLANYPGTSTTAEDAILPDLCVYQIPEDAPDYSTDGVVTLTDEQKNNCKDGDSVNMEKTLLEKYGYAPGNIHTFSDSRAKFSAIKGAVDSILADLTEKDEVTFFFSGHAVLGYGDPDGDLWEDEDGGIVVYDEKYDFAKYMDTATPYTDPATGIEYNNYKTYYDKIGYDDSAYIWDGQLKDWFAGAATDRIFFAFDTCHAAEMDDLEEPVDADGIGRVLAFSSGKDQSSYTYYLGGEINSGNVHDSEGLFSHYFVLRAMYDGYADGSNPLKKTNPLKKDGLVAVEEAFSYAYPLVTEATSNRQMPHLDDLFTNDLVLGYAPVSQ